MGGGGGGPMGGPRGMRPDWNRPPMHGGGQFQQGPMQGHPQGPPHMQQGGPPRGGPPPQQMGVSDGKSDAEAAGLLNSPIPVPALQPDDGRQLWPSTAREPGLLQPGPHGTRAPATTTSEWAATVEHGRPPAAAAQPVQPDGTTRTVAGTDGQRWRRAWRRRGC